MSKVNAAKHVAVFTHPHIYIYFYMNYTSSIWRHPFQPKSLHVSYTWFMFQCGVNGCFWGRYTLVSPTCFTKCLIDSRSICNHFRHMSGTHNAGYRFASWVTDLLQWFTWKPSPVSRMYMEANAAPLEERQLKLLKHYYLKTRACTDNPAHHALHVFDPTTREPYLPRSTWIWSNETPLWGSGSE